jgi:3-hydroxyisobutyrate dehydrogenase-like beta-hydroxyacid dehydrogenase
MPPDAGGGMDLPVMIPCMPKTESRRIAVIGAGRMGVPMCARLVDRGFAVTATDLRSERRSQVIAVGAAWAESATAAAAASDIAISVLPGPAEVLAVTSALLAGLAPGATWVEMSTADQATARVTTTAATERGVRTLDAPVGGGPVTAREGRLLAFVGGPPEDVEAQRDVLEALANRVIPVGPAGSGYAVKLLVNMLWFTQAIAHAEALTLAARAGVNPETFRRAVMESVAAGRFAEHDVPALLRGDDLTSFSLARCCEQLASVLALGEELDVALDLGACVTALHERAREHFGDVDGELLGARFVADRAGVDLTVGRDAT